MESTLQHLSSIESPGSDLFPNPRGTEARSDAGLMENAVPYLADVPAIDIEIPQKGNARHDVKGNSPIGPLNDVLVFRNRPSWAKRISPNRNPATFFGGFTNGYRAQFDSRQAGEIDGGRTHRFECRPPHLELGKDGRSNRLRSVDSGRNRYWKSAHRQGYPRGKP